MSLTAKFTISVKAYQGGATDTHGNATDAWADPVDVAVYGIAPTTSTEPAVGRTEVTEGLTVYAPSGTAIGPRDRVVIDGLEYEVIGDLGAWGSHSPFSWDPGISFDLKRVEG